MIDVRLNPRVLGVGVMTLLKFTFFLFALIIIGSFEVKFTSHKFLFCGLRRVLQNT